jgi:hypothetical protein
MEQSKITQYSIMPEPDMLMGAHGTHVSPFKRIAGNRLMVLNQSILALGEKRNALTR